MAADINPSGAKLDFSDDMSYGDYLSLDTVLNAQHPLSTDHNEMLFIMNGSVVTTDWHGTYIGCFAYRPTFSTC